jgi:uncharacterized protein HemY
MHECIQVQPGILENVIAAEESVRSWSCIRQQRRAAEQNLNALVQSFGGIQKKLRTLPEYAHAAANQAVTLLYCIATQVSQSGEQSAEREQLEHKVWQAISEAQYISHSTCYTFAASNSSMMDESCPAERMTQKGSWRCNSRLQRA